MNTQQKKLISYSYDLLAMRRYTVRDMIKKLDAANLKFPEPLTEPELQEIIESLLRSNFLNDKEYAEFYLDAKVRRKPLGRLKITQEMERKGLSADLISQAFNKYDFDETAMVRLSLAKKLRLLHNPSLNDLKTRQKIFRYLQSQGFQSDSIFRVIKETD